MSFDSLTFWVFFACAYCLWRYLPFAWAKTATLLSSLFFYGWWNPKYLILIAISAIIDYVAGKKIHAADSKKSRLAWLCLSLIVNLGMLAVFKYGHFALSSAGELGWNLGITKDQLRWVIPVGISFYTFQTLSYSIDIYRKRLAPCESFRDFFLFVSFFPQLVAGPIVRAGDLLPQFLRRRRLSWVRAQMGGYYIITGLFLKMVVADNLALPVAWSFQYAEAGVATPIQVWIGIFCFSARIYADFAGYSSIAIGLACLMGLSFPRNFNYPYISAGLSEFWRRWHISLSTWLRDYLYISLGGSRKGRHLTYFNLMITMLLGGLWHGPSWTFVAWGGLHGIGLCIERLLRGENAARICIPKNRWSYPSQILRIIATFIFVQVTWVFFYAKDFSAAARYLHTMFIAPFTSSFGTIMIYRRFWPFLFLVIALHGAQLVHEWFGVRKSSYRRAIVAGIMILLLLIIRRPEGNAFIYFQF